MAKLTLAPISALPSAVGTVNNNSDLIEAAIENTLSRDGTSPNQMLSDLDLNNNDLLNAQSVRTSQLFVSGVRVIAAEAVNASNFATAAQGVLADTALQPSYLGFSGTGGHNTIARLPLQDFNHQPVQYPGIIGSLGKGMIFREVTRTGGYGQYGDILVDGLVTASTVTGEFDVGITSWMTSTNLQGGAIFGSWSGANTPARGYGNYSGGQATGLEVNIGNRWGDTGLLTSLANTRHTSGLQVVPDVLPTRNTVNYPVTISVASPAVFTSVGHGLSVDTPVRVFSTGTIPGGISQGTTYFVNSVTTDTFTLKTLIYGGTVVNTSNSGSGSMSYIPSYPANFGVLVAPSIHGHRWWVGTMIPYGSIMKNGYTTYAAGGGDPADQPAAFLKTAGYYKRGLDFEGTVYSDAVINFDYNGQTVASTGTASGRALKFMVSGTPIYLEYKV